MSHVFTDCNATLVLANSSVVVVYIDLINFASVFVMQFTANITSTVRPAQSITTASSATWDSRPVGAAYPGRQRNESNGGASTSTTFNIAVPTITSALNQTSLLETPDTPVPRVNIGEEITYVTTLTLPEEQMRLSMTVTTPSGLLLRSAYVASIGRQIISPVVSVLAIPTLMTTSTVFSISRKLRMCLTT